MPRIIAWKISMCILVERRAILTLSDLGKGCRRSVQNPIVACHNA